MLLQSLFPTLTGIYGGGGDKPDTPNTNLTAVNEFVPDFPTPNHELYDRMCYVTLIVLIKEIRGSILILKRIF